jgi:multiple sugar transport system ATP-binding protein
VQFANATDEAAQVIVRWDPKNPPRAGQTITVSAQQSAVHLFNATTGERI